MLRLACITSLAFCVMSLCAAAPQPKLTPISVHVKGTISGDVVATQVPVVGTGTGRAGRFGEVAAEAVWAPSLAAVLQLLSGEVDDLTINSGSFAAELEDGSTISGTLSGVVVLQGNTKIGMTCQFVVTDGTGQFAGAVGGGVMHGWADYQTLDFHVTLHASLELP